MSKKLLSYDPLTKMAQWHYYDHSTGKTHIKTVQECQNILDRNKQKQNSHNTSRYSKKDELYHFASVPNTVLMEWKQKYGIDWNKKEDSPRIEKLLQSNEYKYLRTVDRI